MRKLFSIAALGLALATGAQAQSWPAKPVTMGADIEVPLKRMAQGVPLEKALTLGAVDDPEAVRWFADLLAARASRR